MFIARRLLGVGNFYCVGAVCQGFIFDFSRAAFRKTSPGRRFNSDWRFIAVYCADDFCFFTAFLIALPYVLYEVWRFIAPGLYAHEKKLVLPLIASSTVLFFIGMAFAYFLVFQTVFGFITAISPEGVNWTPDIAEYFSFAITLFIAFGVAFEIPVVVYLLVHAGVTEVETLKKARPYIIVGAFVVAAIFTPPDVISQLMLAIPCWLLFELGLLLAPKKKKD